MHCACTSHWQQGVEKTEPLPTANELQILLTHLPTLKFATHLLLAYTQENFTYMTIDYSKQKDKKIIIVEKSRTIQVDIETVKYFECDGHLVFIFHTNGEQPYHYTDTIKKLELDFEGIGFLRICPKRLVNMKFIEIICSKKHEIQLNTGQCLIVSRRRWHNIKQFFSKQETKK